MMMPYYALTLSLIPSDNWGHATIEPLNTTTMLNLLLLV
jgi:hypothetical protein